MLHSRTFGRAGQLKDSYIAISNYVRGRYNHPSPKLKRSFTHQTILRSTEFEGKTAQIQQDDLPVSEGRRQGLSGSQNDNIGPLSQYKQKFNLPPATSNWDRWDLRPNQTSTMHGYITSSRRGAKTLDFVELVDPQLRKTLQLIVDEAVVGHEVREKIRNIRAHSPVAVSGQLSTRPAERMPKDPRLRGERPSTTSDAAGPNIVYQTSPEIKSARTEESAADQSDAFVPPTEFKSNPYVGDVATTPRLELRVESIKPLNYFPEDIIAQVDTKFPPEQRHLQLRTNSTLRSTLQARSKAQTESRKYLFMKGFDEIETPILFKSTPEGAREFLVPTRQRGLAYALPQSPQQFKQILMASGISKYFQFARCFRDEDMRADRQPEFTQLDIEMSFASAEDVMKITERIIQVLWQTFFRTTIFPQKIRYPLEYKMRDIPHHAPLYFPQVTYQHAMTTWGSDKPDTRFGSRIRQAQDFLDETLKSRITSLEDPIIDLMRVRVSSPEQTKKFISSFLDRPSASAYMDNSHGAPGIFIFDPSKPMNGLSAFEHDAAEKIVQLLHPARGDLLVLQARPNRPFMGESSTMIGNLRRDLHMALVSEDISRKPAGHDFVWVTHFPLFSPTNDADPGQGGMAGIKSTHHPFTAPKTLSDVDKLTTDPLSCTADHFDLVIDGVEVGGGSRRIHDSKVQEMVLKDILKVPEKQAEEFRPLLEALRAGCPPHAGIALGFDRLMAILRQTSSVRDVIAFPKSANGEDKMVGAPSSVGVQRWAEYHMTVEGGEDGRDAREKKDELTGGSSEVEQELRNAAGPSS